MPDYNILIANENPLELFFCFTIILMKVLALYGISASKKWGVIFFFAMIGISSRQLYYSYLRIGYGGIDSLEWIFELLFIIPAITVYLLYNKKTRINFSNQFLYFFLAILIALIISTREITIASMTTIVSALYPVALFIFLALFWREEGIEKTRFTSLILISILSSIVFTIILVIFGKNLIQIDSLGSYVRTRFSGSLGPFQYSMFLLPFTLFFFANKNWIPLILTTTLILLTGTRINIFVLIMAAGFMVVLINRNYKKLLLLSSVLIIITLPYLFNYIQLYNNGRISIWSTVLSSSLNDFDKLIFGNGTGYSKNLIYHILPKYGHGIISIHNQFLKISVDTGVIISLVIYIGFVFSSLIRILKRSTLTSLEASFALILPFVLIIPSFLDDCFVPMMYKNYLILSSYSYFINTNKSFEFFSSKIEYS